MYFSFLSFLVVTLSFCTLVLWPLSDSKHCTYLCYIYMMTLLSFHLSLHVFFFFLFIHMFLMYAILYFCFTLRCCDEFCLKYFRKTCCQNLSCHELSSYKVFQEFVLELDFIVFNKWVWVECFMTSLICSFVYCGFVIDYQMGRLLRHMWNLLEHMLL